jgi:hypothetical protein
LGKKYEEEREGKGGKKKRTGTLGESSVSDPNPHGSGSGVFIFS